MIKEVKNKVFEIDNLSNVNSVIALLNEQKKMICS